MNLSLIDVYQSIDPIYRGQHNCRYIYILLICTRYHVTRNASIKQCHAVSVAALDHRSVEITTGIGVVSLTEHAGVYCVLGISLT